MALENQEPNPYEGFDEAAYGAPQDTEQQTPDSAAETQGVEQETETGDQEYTEGAPVISDELRRRAEYYDVFSEEDLSKYESEEDLRRDLQLLDRQYALFAKNSRAPQQQPLPQQQPPLQQEPPSQPAVTEEALAMLEGMDADDPVRKTFEALHGEISAMRGTLEQQKQEQAQTWANNVLTWLDQKHDSMNSDLYGRGPSASPVERRARDDVNAVFLAQLEYAMSRGLPFDYDQAYIRAQNGVHGALNITKNDQKRVEAIRQRAKQRSATGRAKGSPSYVQTSTGKIVDLTSNPDLMEKVNEIYANPR